MTKIIELDEVYLELPDILENSQNEKDLMEFKTAKLSLEELEKKLEETQALHL